jgi:hypothetical protein
VSVIGPALRKSWRGCTTLTASIHGFVRRARSAGLRVPAPPPVPGPPTGTAGALANSRVPPVETGQNAASVPTNKIPRLHGDVVCLDVAGQPRFHSAVVPEELSAACAPAANGTERAGRRKRSLTHAHLASWHRHAKPQASALSGASVSSPTNTGQTVTSCRPSSRRRNHTSCGTPCV